MDEQPPSRLADLSRQVAALSNQVVAQARAAGRDDLADLLTTTAARWGDPQVTVVVAGEIGVGKSSLVSALSGYPELLPAASEATTGVLTTVSAGEPGEGTQVEAWVDDRTDPVPLSLAELADWAGIGGDRRGAIARIDVRVPDPATGPRVVLVDTPGVAGPHTTADRLVLAVLARADILLFVTDADAPVGRTELDFLERAREEIGTCVVALSRIDRFRGWTTIQADSAAILDRELGDWAPAAVGVSSMLATAALELAASGDHPNAAEVAAEAGIDQLRAVVLGLAQRSKHVRLAGLLQVVRRVVAGLAEPASTVGLVAVASPEDLQAELARCRDDHASLKTRGSAVLAAIGDEVGALREQLGVDLRRTVGEVTLDHEDRLLNPKADPDEVLDAMEHDLRAAKLRFAGEVDVELAALRDRLTARLEGTGEELVEPDGELEGGRRPRRVTGPVPDHGLRLRVAAAIASAGGGTVMMGMSVASAGAAGNTLRTGLMGVSMVLGGFVANSGVRQSRQQKVLQTVRTQARTILDEWQAETLAQARGRVLAGQRELEAAIRDAVRGRLGDLDAEAKALQSGAQAPVETGAAMADLTALAEAATRLDGAVRSALTVAVGVPVAPGA